jgi:hypothetical protein
MTPSNATHLLRALGWLILALILSILAVAVDGQTPTAPTPKLDKVEFSLLVADSASRGLDTWSTRRMLSRGDREDFLPQAIVNRTSTMLAYSEGTVAVDWLAMRWLNRRGKWGRRTARGILAADLGQNLFWGVHNLKLKPAPSQRNPDPLRSR